MNPPRVVTEMQMLGPGLWERRHKADLALERGEVSIPQWLAELEDWKQRIPRSCDCISHWDEWVKTNPPDPARAFEWGVDAHNAVNERLVYPIWNYAAARDRWS